MKVLVVYHSIYGIRENPSVTGLHELHTAAAAIATSLLNKNTGCTMRHFICWFTPLIRTRFSIFTCSGVPAGNTRGTISLDAGTAEMKQSKTENRPLADM